MVSDEMAHLIANFAMFLEFADAEILDEDAAVEMMEQLAGDIEALDKDTRLSLADALRSIASSYQEEKLRQFVEDMPEALGITDFS